MVAYTKPQHRRKKEESERLRGEGDQIKFTTHSWVKDDLSS